MSEEVRREVDTYGNIRYYNKKGQYHRLDGPAVEYSDGTKDWYQNGRLHRIDGPAIEDPFYDILSWYIDGKCYATQKAWEKACCPSIEEAAAMFNEVQHER